MEIEIRNARSDGFAARFARTSIEFALFGHELPQRVQVDLRGVAGRGLSGPVGCGLRAHFESLGVIEVGATGADAYAALVRAAELLDVAAGERARPVPIQVAALRAERRLVRESLPAA